VKSIVLLLVGLFIGVLGTVAGMSALKQGTPYNDAVMAALGHQMGAFKGMRESGSCDAAEISRRLNVMGAMADEVAPAFLPVGDDAKFTQLAQDLRNAVTKASATVAQQAAAGTAACETLSKVTPEIGATCKGCHDVFR